MFRDKKSNFAQKFFKKTGSEACPSTFPVQQTDTVWIKSGGGTKLASRNNLNPSLTFQKFRVSNKTVVFTIPSNVGGRGERINIW